MEWVAARLTRRGKKGKCALEVGGWEGGNEERDGMTKRPEFSATWWVCGAYRCFIAGGKECALHRGNKPPRCIKHGLLLELHPAINPGRLISREKAKQLMRFYLDNV